MPEPRLEPVGQVLERAGPRMPIDVVEDILDEQLAAKPLAEELDVAPEDRPEVEEQRRRLLGEEATGTSGMPWRE